jgi:hypothetical protein
MLHLLTVRLFDLQKSTYSLPRQALGTLNNEEAFNVKKGIGARLFVPCAAGGSTAQPPHC